MRKTKYQLLILPRRPESDYLTVEMAGRCPDNLWPHHFYVVHTFEDADLLNETPEEYARRWLSKNHPEYKGLFKILEVKPGPGRGHRKKFHPTNACGPILIFEGSVIIIEEEDMFPW